MTPTRAYCLFPLGWHCFHYYPVCEPRLRRICLALSYRLAHEHLPLLAVDGNISASTFVLTEFHRHRAAGKDDARRVLSHSRMSRCCCQDPTDLSVVLPQGARRRADG